MKKVFIAVDNGNKFTKSSDGFLEETSLREVEGDIPVYNSNTLIEYNKKCYVIGEGRMSVLMDKTMDDRTFIITIAAICNKLAKEELDGINVGVHLAVGLPLISYSKQRKNFKEYFNRKGIECIYKSKKYIFDIESVYVFPQGIAAYTLFYKDFKEFDTSVVVDIGGYTIDIFSTNHKGLPILTTLRSYDKGVITILEEIKQELLKEDIRLTDGQIENVILNKDMFLTDDKIIKIVEKIVSRNLIELVYKLKEDKYELKNPVLLTGGGATLLEEALRGLKEFNYVQVADIFANSNGYLQMMKEQYSRDNKVVK